VGDDDERAAPGEQVSGEPVDAAHVEMVGRLVEDKQVGRPDEQCRQRDAAALTPGHRRDRCVQTEVRHAEPVEDRPYGRVAGPLVLGAHVLVEPGVAEHDIAHRRIGR
jgi:hypothetical protein